MKIFPPPPHILGLAYLTYEHVGPPAVKVSIMSRETLGLNLKGSIGTSR